MFSLGILCLLFLCQTGGAVGYIELYTLPARMGLNTTIPCKFNVNAVPPSRQTFTIMWHFQEKEIFRYPTDPKTPNSRLSIDQDRIKDGIADMYISRVSISDGGLYKCSMVQSSEKKEKEIRLDVNAPPRITITDKNVVITKESVLSCAMSGFFPVDIDIKWFRDRIILNNVTVERPQRDPDGTYSVRSSVTITPTEEDRERIFSCRVQHGSLTAPLQEDFQLVFGDPTEEKSSTLNAAIIAAIAAVLLLIVMISAAAIIWFRKKGQNNQNEANNLENQPGHSVSDTPLDNQEGLNQAKTGSEFGSPGCEKTKPSADTERRPFNHDCGGVDVKERIKRIEKQSRANMTSAKET